MKCCFGICAFLEMKCCFGIGAFLLAVYSCISIASSVIFIVTLSTCLTIGKQNHALFVTAIITGILTGFNILVI